MRIYSINPFSGQFNLTEVKLCEMLAFHKKVHLLSPSGCVLEVIINLKNISGKRSGIQNFCVFL